MPRTTLRSLFLGACAAFSIGLSMTTTTLAATPFDPCKLVDTADWTALLGGPPKFLPTQGPEAIEDSKGTETYCSGFATGPTGGINVVVSIMRFSSAAEAKAVATKDALAGQIQDGKVAIVAEAGAAEPIYWASSKETGLYVIFKGEKVISLVVSGEKPPAAHKSRMREPALRIATKA